MNRYSLSPASRTVWVTIGIPTYNRAQFLPRALESLLGQTYRDIEFIISDNASTDETEAIVKKYTAQDSRIRSVRQEKNIGAIANHEFVLREAHGKYFMWASDDDWWDPRFVETLVKVLEENPEYGVAMSHFYEKRIYPGDYVNTRARTHNFTSCSYQEVCSFHLRHGRTPIFTFGLWRTDFFKKIHTRPTAITLEGTLVLLAEAALGTKFYSVPLPLHTRFQDKRSRLERHPPASNPFSQQEFTALFPYTRYLLIVFWRLATSPVVPLSRRHLFLLPWLRAVLLKKHLVIRECRRFLMYCISPKKYAAMYPRYLYPASRTVWVTIGIPTYNRAQFLPRALESLLGQTYRDIEFIISDNASTDETEAIVKKYTAQDSRIRSVRQEKNIGAIANHEFVLREAHGKYFMWASDDDWWDPRFVETLVKVLEENPEYGVAMSHYYEKRQYPDGHTELVLRKHNLTHRSYQETFYFHFRHGKTPIFTFGLFRTKLLKNLHSRPTAITFQCTLALLAEAALAFRFYSVPKPLHTRLQDMRSRLERHPASHPFSYQEFIAPFPLTRYFLVMFWRLVSSRVIPLSQKHLFLKPWCQRLWLKKRKIAREFIRFFRLF